jgi:DHA2 family multidrug resistance protein
MRNVGGSVGIALVATLVARSAQSHQANLVTHMTPFDPAYQSRVQALQGAFAANGDTVLAHQQALGSVYGTLVQQSTLLAYLDNFRWFALLCFLCIGMTMLLKNVKARGPVSAH